MLGDHGGAGGDWTLPELAELFGVLGDLGTPAGTTALLERLTRFLHADGGVCLVGDIPAMVGRLGGGMQDAVAASAGPDVRTIEIPGVGCVHSLVVALESGTGDQLALVRAAEPFTGQERLLVRSVARMLELSLSSTRSIALLEERTALLGVLREVERSISEQSSLADTLQRITDGARQLFGKVLAGVVLRRDDQLELVAGAPRTATPVIEFPMVLRHSTRLDSLLRQPGLVEIPDYAQIPDPSHVVLALGIRRVLVAPIGTGPEPLGCILIGTTTTERSFTEDQRDALRLLADHAAFAIDNVSAREAAAASVAELERRAITDDLTGLLNRRGLFDAIEAVLASGPADGPITVLFIDLDRFKFVNDVHGHHVADRLLVEAARRLKEMAGDAIVGRLAGDEFVVLLRGDVVASEEQASRIRWALEQPFEVDGVCVHVGASVGVAAVNGHRTASQLLMDADLAMMEAKQQGRGRTVRYGAGLRADFDHRATLELSIRDALHQHRFELHLQPIVGLATGSVERAETLLRWPDLDGSHVRPGSVLGVAADAGLLPMLDMAIVRTALCYLKQIRERTGRAEFGITVNLTPATVSLPDLSDRVLDELLRAGLAPSSLTIELVETAALDSDVTIANLDELDAAGVSIALDNFGAGWSSLQRLRRVPVTFLKIDRALVGGIGTDLAGEAIMHGLLQLAPAVGVEIVAEGVESAAAAAWLRERGCAFAQGFQFGRPMPLDALVTTLMHPVAVGI